MPESRQWAPIPKEEVKELFRQGDEVRIMLGTDSMSEGLNLQTCARVVNFDLPWNFMRVEQRIGRVDRIGGQPKVEVTNLFYSDTVEDDIYRRIRDRLDWFTNVVGNAQPVLAATESVFERAAMGRIDPATAANELIGTADQLERAPIKLTDLDAVPEHETELQPAMTLNDLRDALLSIPSCRDRLTPHPHYSDAWLLSLDDTSPHPVTFNPARHQDTPQIALLTWSNPPPKPPPRSSWFRLDGSQSKEVLGLFPQSEYRKWSKSKPLFLGIWPNVRTVDRREQYDQL